MSAYDSWLEKPYVDRAREDAAYEQFCEAYDLDPAEDNEAEFEDWLEAMSEPDPDDLRDQMLDREWDYDD